MDRKLKNTTATHSVFFTEEKSIKFKNLVLAHSLGGSVGVGGLWGGRSREEGDNVWLWLGERVVVAVG